MPKIDNMVFVELDDITGLVDLVCLFGLVDPGDLFAHGTLAYVGDSYFNLFFYLDHVEY